MVNVDLSAVTGFEPESCHAWALEDSLDSPDSDSSSYLDGSVLSLSDSVYACVLDYELDADCAYGVAFTHSEATTSAGVYGPVGVHTRTGDAETGPVVDSNDVLDIV
jgi:hypothetical protein